MSTVDRTSIERWDSVSENNPTETPTRPAQLQLQPSPQPPDGSSKNVIGIFRSISRMSLGQSSPHTAPHHHDNPGMASPSIADNHNTGAGLLQRAESAAAPMPIPGSNPATGRAKTGFNSFLSSWRTGGAGLSSHPKRDASAHAAQYETPGVSSADKGRALPTSTPLSKSNSSNGLNRRPQIPHQNEGSMHGGDGPRSPSHALTNLISRSSDAEERLMDEPRDASGEQMQVSVPSPVHRSTAGVRPLSDTGDGGDGAHCTDPTPTSTMGLGPHDRKRSQPLRLLSCGESGIVHGPQGTVTPFTPTSPQHMASSAGVSFTARGSDSSARPLSVFDPGYSYTSGTQTGPPSATPGLSSRNSGLFAAYEPPAPNSREVADSEVPSSIFFDFVTANGRAPPPRWDHAAAAVGDCLYIVGGIGIQSFDDVHIYDVVRNQWQNATPSGAGKDTAPPAMFGAAACSVGRCVFLVGGRTGRRYVRKTYVCDTDTMRWTALKAGAQEPPGSDGHSLTRVSPNTLLFFGGQGKKLNNTLYCLDTQTYTWRIVEASGAKPAARWAHTALWDGGDRLFIFGGQTQSHHLGDLHYFSLQDKRWYQPACTGPAPSPRQGARAALLCANLMLIFGGCSETDVFFNDAHILNLTTFTWHSLTGHGVIPAGRYGHSLTPFGNRLVMFGGVNNGQSFDGIVTMTVDLGAELNAVAEGLVRLAPQGTNTPSAATLTRSLHDTLRLNAAQELLGSANRRAQVAEGLFQQERERVRALEAELQTLKLLLEEAVHEKESLESQVQKERSASLRFQQEAQLIRRELSKIKDDVSAEKLQTTKAERETARLRERVLLLEQAAEGQRQDLEAEKAKVSSREEMVARTIQEKGAALQQLAATEAALRKQEANVTQLQGRVREAEMALAAEKIAAAAGPLPSPTLGSALSPYPSLLPRNPSPFLATRTRTMSPAPMRLPTPSPTHSNSSWDGESLGAMRWELACLHGDQSALSQLTLHELLGLETRLEVGWRAVRAALASAQAAELAAREAALRRKELETEETCMCSVCMDGPLDCALGCGHRMCQGCAHMQQLCPFCSQPVELRIRLF